MSQNSSNKSSYRPHISTPGNSRRPVRSNEPVSTTPYAFEVTPPDYDISEALVNPWESQSLSLDTPRPRVHSMVELSGRPPSRTTSASATMARSDNIAFPEPQLYRSLSSSSRPTLQSGDTRHRHPRSELGSFPAGTHLGPSAVSSVSIASSYVLDDDSDHYGSGFGDYGSEVDQFSRNLSNLSLDYEESLRRFQVGELPEVDQAWHRLVPLEARGALGEQEVQRQSVLFEVFKAERDYVSDLEAVEEVFIKGLRDSSPPIIPQSRLDGFVDEVFGNIRQILAHHQRMLGALFSRQREQHPLVQSVADIILDTVLITDFRSSYDTYIKHYPLAESYHRKESKANPAYQNFLQSVSADPRIRKRDLITFLSRPVTRLPRLNLLLEQILKLTDKEYEHPDLDTLPIILGILGDAIKSTQPGIEAAESKVKFWALCESLVFQKGEIMDLDLYDESRTLVYSGPVSRRSRTDSGWSESWLDLTGALLDNFFILTREEKRSNGLKRHVVSRPLPLSYVRLGSFTSPPETRKERTDDGHLLDSLRSQYITIYPFTIYHASNKTTRRYTLYAASESIRKRWHSAFVNAIGVHKVRQESNMWFDPRTLTDRSFTISSPRVETAGRISGRVISAAPFTSNGRKFVAVGCQNGVYVGSRGSEDFRKVFTSPNPSIAAIPGIGQKTINAFIIHSEMSLMSYSLDALAHAALNEVQPNTLEATYEKLDGSVIFFRHVYVGDRALVIYTSKRRLGTSMSLHVLEAVHTSPVLMPPRRQPPTASFRTFGEPGYVPKDAYDITPLTKTVGICTKDGIVIVDPTNLTNSTVTVVPDLHDASTNLPMASLKARLEDARPLGLIRVSHSELLVVYDAVGFYITKHGIPSRKSAYIKWETKVTSFAHRGNHVMLFSPHFIEIRNLTTSRIVQVIEGQDIRLLYSGFAHGEDENVIVAMRGARDDKHGISEKIIELAETSEISVTPATPAALPAMWDEWDM